MIVRELITRMGFNVRSGDLNKVERATDRVRDRAESAANAFRNIFAGLAGLAAVKSIVTVADEMQSLRSRISLLQQTVGDVGQSFEEVAKRASDARAPIEAYAGLYTRLGNAGKDYIKTQEDLLGITDTISRALVVSGATAQEAGSVMIQFSQALGSGVLQGEEFRAMAEAAPQYLDQLALAMNIPREQLKKMASDGKLTSRAVIEATRQMSGYFEDKFRQMPMTVGQATTIIANRFGVMVDRLNRESMFITRIADAIVGGFDKIEAGVAWLGDRFDGFSNVVRASLIAIGVVAAAWAAPLIAGAVAALIAMAPMILIIAGIALALDELYVWINGGKSVIEKWLGPWSKFKLAIVDTWDQLKGFYRWIVDKFSAIGNIIGGVFTLDMDQLKMGLASLSGPDSPTAKYSAEPFRAATIPGMSQPRGIMANTTVNLTVPAGTSPADVEFFSQTAKKSYDKAGDVFARDMLVYAP